MEFTTKDKVLIAIYNEYQKDIPNMNSVSARSLDIELEAFGVAVEKLANEELVNLRNRLEDSIRRGGTGSKVHSTDIGGAMVTRRGIDYVEKRLLETKSDSF